MYSPFFFVPSGLVIGRNRTKCEINKILTVEGCFFFFFFCTSFSITAGCVEVLHLGPPVNQNLERFVLTERRETLVLQNSILMDFSTRPYISGIKVLLGSLAVSFSLHVFITALGP